jgi:hypothetical protein
MTSSMRTQEPQRPSRRWRWVFAGAALCIVSIALGVYQLITLSSDATALRDELASAVSQPMRTRVQVSVGPMLCSLVRMGSLCIDRIPDEARLAMRAVRRASVGVYDLHGDVRTKGRARLIAAADEKMEKRGWTRVVGVNDPGNLVLVYVPQRESSGSTERACVAVCNDEHLVVVSGTLAIEPLVQIAQRHALLARR